MIQKKKKKKKTFLKKKILLFYKGIAFPRWGGEKGILAIKVSLFFPSPISKVDTETQAKRRPCTSP